MYRALQFLVLLLIITPSIGQIPVLTLPNDPSQVDSTTFPYTSYHKVVSYSYNREVDKKSLKGTKKLRRILSRTSINRNPRKYFHTFGTLDSIRKADLHMGKYPIKDGKIAVPAIQKTTLNPLQIDSLNTILQRPTDSTVTTLCVPIYRDGLVFFDKNDAIIGHIDICFHCTSFRINSKNYYKMSLGKWQQLKAYFKESLGHPINE